MITNLSLPLERYERFVADASPVVVVECALPFVEETIAQIVDMLKMSPQSNIVRAVRA